MSKKGEMETRRTAAASTKASYASLKKSPPLPPSAGSADVIPTASSGGTRHYHQHQLQKVLRSPQRASSAAAALPETDDSTGFEAAASLVSAHPHHSRHDSMDKQKVLRSPHRASSAAAAPQPETDDVEENAYEELGEGTYKDPHYMPLRTIKNNSGCMLCPTDTCWCNWFKELLHKTYASLRKKRIVDVSGKREMCAKSLLPPFVSRICEIMDLSDEDTFWDLGCGTGSILFQVAFMTGARCVGVELCPHNAQIARDAWEILRPILEKEAKCTMPEVEIISGDLCEVIADPSFVENPQKVMTSNLLFPRQVTHYMSERFRYLPVGSKVMCFDDLYPHSRSIARIRDPDAFEKFEMKDYKWQPGAVEWCNEPGNFYVHEKVC